MELTDNRYYPSQTKKELGLNPSSNKIYQCCLLEQIIVI